MLNLCDKLKASFSSVIGIDDFPFEKEWVLLGSVSDGKRAALSLVMSADTLDKAWNGLWRKLFRNEPDLLSQQHIRIETPVRVRQTTWGHLKRDLSETKRNYFRLGLSLDANFKHCFLELELNANAALVGDASVSSAQLNVNHFNALGRKKFGPNFELDHEEHTPVWTFETVGVYFGPSLDEPIGLNAGGELSGSRIQPPMGPADIDWLVEQGSEFLARQVKSDGSFVYGIFPCFDRDIPTYNTLRHASSTYAMLEAWEQTKSTALKQAIDLSLDCLCTRLIKVCALPNTMPEQKAAFLVDLDNEVKLGGNAVSLLALCKYTELTEDRQYLELMKQLALAIAAMFNPQSSSFVHVLQFPELSLKEAYRTIYYDGEATFALMRLYKLDPNPLYLRIVELAVDRFIEAGHDKSHDHWLSYCVNELTIYKPERRYFEFGIRNFNSHLDFVLNRITTFPTLLELMMAAEQMLQRLNDQADLRDLLASVDLEKFYRAMHHRANYLRCGFFWPEWAMFFRSQRRIQGAFFIRHHAFRVRIDDVEHYLSGLIAYRKFLLVRTPVAPFGRATNPSMGSQFLKLEWQQTKVWFLNQDIRFKRSGVENASLMRAKLFAECLGKPVSLLTAEYNPELSASVEQLRTAKQLPPEVVVFSIYDNIQQASPDYLVSQTQQKTPVQASGLTRHAIKGEIDFKWFDSRGRLLMYEVHSRETGKLLYVNHFAGGKKIRRDRYDTRGFLSQTQILNPDLGIVLFEQFFRPDGSVALEKFYSPLNGRAVIDHIRVVNLDRQVSGVYQTEEDLITAVLQDCLEDSGQSHLLVVDKNQVFYKPAARVRRDLGKTQPIKLASYIHSVHTQSFVQVERSPLNSNYTAVFDEAFPCDAVWVSTNEQAQDIRSRFHNAPVRSIAQAYDPYLPSVGFESRDRFRVLMFARLGQEKRIDLAIKAFAEVARQIPQARLDIFGFPTSGAAHEKSLHMLIESLGLAQQVCLKGWSSNPAAEYEAAGVCILTSEKEGFSLSLMEAVRHGCPVVAFQVRYGPSDIVIHGENGFLVSFGDTVAMAQAIVRILRDETLHRRFSENARVSGRRFSMESLALKWRENLVALGYRGV